MFLEDLGCARCTNDSTCNVGEREVDVNGLNESLESRNILDLTFCPAVNSERKRRGCPAGSDEGTAVTMR